MMTSLRHIVLSVLVICAFAVAAWAQKYDKWRYWPVDLGTRQYWIFANASEADAAEVRARWDELGESLASSSSLFAGTYLQSGNRGYFLRWSPEKGFVYLKYYEYSVINFSYGDIRIENSIIHFIPQRDLAPLKPTQTTSGTLTPSEWIPVYKGKFFIQKDSIKDFLDYYGGFGEFNGFPRKFNCDCAPFAERADKNFIPEKNPDYIVPSQYGGLIREPIDATILSVGNRYLAKNSGTDMFSIDENGNDRPNSLTPVTINVGRRNGARRGMYFFVEPDFGGIDQILRITVVGNRTSEAVVVRKVSDSKDERYEEWGDGSTPVWRKYPPLRAGLKVTTRAITDK